MILKIEGKHNCTAFCDEDVFQLYISVLESVIHTIIRIIKRYKHYKENIAKDLEAEHWIRIDRSPRKGYLNEAMYQGLGESVTKLIHRWGSYEKKKDQTARFYLIHNYAAGRNSRYKELQIFKCL